MAEPAQKFTDWLAQHRAGVADVELSEALEEVVAAVVRSYKKNATGALKLTLKFRAEGDTVLVTDAFATAIPDDSAPRAYFVGADGALTRTNPLQPSLLDQEKANG